MKLKIKTAEAYVRAVSGLFITSKTPSGLTPTEITIIAKLMKHSKDGNINFISRRKVIDEMEFRPQTFYNMVVVLKRKGAIINNQLHKIFSSGKLLIEYADDQEDS